MLKKVEQDQIYGPVAHYSIDATPVRKQSVFAKLSWGVIQAIFMVAILVAAGFVTKRMIAAKPPTKQRPAFKTVYTIETVTAKKADNQPKFVSYGQITAAKSVDLRALVGGEIVSVNPKMGAGAKVTKGDALVNIDPFNYRGAVQEAQAGLTEAKAKIAENEARIVLEKGKVENYREQLAFAEADLQRAEKLLKRGSSTQQQLETRKLVVSQRKQQLALSQDTITVEEARLEQLKASLPRMQWGVDKAQRNLDSTTLVAPFTGIVKSSTAEAGRLVGANDVVVSLYEEGTLEAKFTLTDAQYGRLQTAKDGLVGRPVDVVWTVGGKAYSWPGTIERLGAEITSSRGGVEVFAVVKDAPNEVSLRPGAFVEVNVPDVAFAQSVKVPDTAIYGTDTAYVAIDGKLVERKIDIAAFEGESALISSGLNDGDEVLITRITEVSEGLRVRKEGDPVPERRAGNATPSGQQTGRPDREEMGKILKANDIDRDAFRALSRADKQAMIDKWRAANPPKASN